MRGARRWGSPVPEAAPEKQWEAARGAGVRVRVVR